MAYYCIRRVFIQFAYIYGSFNMLNKIVKKLLVFLLCFACAMPFIGAPISNVYANSNYDSAN